MAWHPTGRARVSASNPSAFAICDRCGLQYNRQDLVYQFQWQGFGLQNLNVLVCTATCLDIPQPQLRAILLPPDPVPIDDPRPERYAQEVPSYMTADGDHFVTLGGDNLISEVRVTPSPDPNNPYYFVEA